MVTIVNGQIDYDSLEVADVIDLEVLKDFLDNFAIGMNCAAVSVDRDGKELTSPSYYRDFCNNYIHRSEIGDSRCAECHSEMGRQSVKTGKPYIGVCHAGLIDFASPIMVNGHHLGTILGGQILDHEPDEKMIRKVAEEVNIDSDKLLNAAKNIDIVNHRNIAAAADVLYIVAGQLATEGYVKLEMKMVANDLFENFKQIGDTVELLAESAQSITLNQHELTEKIQMVDEIANNVKTVLSSIEGIANTTKFIGINASIEAARIGEAGRGFSVVAHEIQNLSVRSKEITNNIRTMNENITSKVSETLNMADNTLKTTEDQSAAMEELSATVQNLNSITNKMEELFK